MNKIMFVADLTGTPEIKETEVRKYTSVHVTLTNNRRAMRITKTRIYCETHEDAARQLADYYANQVRVVRDRLAEMERRLELIRSWG